MRCGRVRVGMRRGRLHRSCVSLCFFFKQKTAYEITYGDWSSDVCSSDHFKKRQHMKPYHLFFALPLLTVISCGPSAEEKAKQERQNSIVSNNIANGYISSSAAVENRKDTTHKFIRTAELKFKVNSVIKSTLSIENIVTKSNGFV